MTGETDLKTLLASMTPELLDGIYVFATLAPGVPQPEGLDPVMVFLSLMLFGWLWGVVGLLLAMPLLTCVRIIAERIPAWNALAKMLAA